VPKIFSCWLDALLLSPWQPDDPDNSEPFGLRTGLALGETGLLFHVYFFQRNLTQVCNLQCQSIGKLSGYFLNKSMTKLSNIDEMYRLKSVYSKQSFL
jgi:hypothetical protein